MKIRKTNIFLLIIFVLGLSIFSYYLREQEIRKQRQELINNGHHLIKLLSLYPQDIFQGKRKDLILRTIVQTISTKNLAYLLVHDANGRVDISLSPREIISQIPEEIEQNALVSNGLKQQSFQLPHLEPTIYEFSKPIFRDDSRSGTIRLGLTPTPVPLLTDQNTSLLGIIAFFLLLVILVSHFGISRELKSLNPHNLGVDHHGDNWALISNELLDSGQCFQFIENLRESMTAVNTRLNKLESQNVDLASKVEINTFEKGQVMRILDSVLIGFVVLDMQNFVTHVNRYGLSLMNQHYDDVIDKKIDQVLTNEPIISFLDRTPELEGSGTDHKVETTFPDIAPGKTFQVSFSYLHDNDDQAIGKILIIENITNQKLAESAKGEFIAHVAHEIRTPMTNIKSYNEMLMNNEIDDEELRIEFFNTINYEIERLNDLINNLLNISKIEMGNLVVNKGLVKSDALVQECIKSIEAAAMEKNINIETDFPDNFPNLFVDKELFRVSILNVIGNALKYTPENGQITFSLQERNGQVVFEVTDTGYGISDKDLPHVFDKFYRSEEDDVAAQKGSGLGLALVNEVIRLHDGTVEIQSERNKGTQVSINIPKEKYYLGKS